MRLKFFSYYLIALVGLVGIIAPSLVHAVSPSSISVNITPKNPAPKENTTITLSSYASNLDSVVISWSVNGKSVQSGIGKKSFSINAPEVGGEVNISIIIYLPDGSIEKRVTLRPVVMALLWQANDSYVPPFYKGKAMPSPGSEIKIVAIPEIQAGSGVVHPRNMVYNWKKDYTNQADSSGYGKDSFIYVNDYLENYNTVSVTASTTDQKFSSGKSIDIGPSEPKILFYKIDPKLGTRWEHALSDGHRIVGEEIVQAAPYFISPQDIRIPFLTFNWFINNYQIAVPSSKKDTMPLRVQNGASGSSELKLEIENSEKIYQSVTGKVNLEF